MSTGVSIHRFGGTPHDAGQAQGHALGPIIRDLIHHYLDEGLLGAGLIDADQLRDHSMHWFRHLPQRYREEMSAIAEAAHLPLQRYVEFHYAEYCHTAGCSSLVLKIRGRVWVARNNDAPVTGIPGVWDHVIVREISDRIPVMLFGMPGTICSATGINARGIWLHYNHLALAHRDEPSGLKSTMASWMFLTEALETCASLADVEQLLYNTDRDDDGMILFAVDGQANEFAVHDCTLTAQHRRDPVEGAIVATNHPETIPPDDPSEGHLDSSLLRFDQIHHMLDTHRPQDPPGDLITILSDPVVEQNRGDFGTVYATVCAPAAGEIWHAANRYPAASRATWEHLEWPWATRPQPLGSDAPA